MATRVGRPCKPIEWKYIRYNDQDYIVGKIQFNDDYIYSINDAYDQTKIDEYHWHVVAGSYIGCDIKHEGSYKVLYMHNHVMDRNGFLGKGQTTSIDHINGIGFDNRHANLREISQSLQNMNTSQRNRTTCKIPNDISLSEIPKHIWYIPVTKTHGDRFVVEIKGIPDIGNICKKTTSSRDISTRKKLEQAIQIRNNIFDKYPILKEYARDSDKSKILRQEYENIVAIFKGEYLPYPIIDNIQKESATLVDIPSTTITHVYSDESPREHDTINASVVVTTDIPKIPKQWKVNDIYNFISSGKEIYYKSYCEENNDLAKISNWEILWNNLLTSVKGNALKDCETFIRSFIESLRSIRHLSLCEKKRDILNREDRKIWPAESIDQLFQEGRISEFKKYTEEMTGDSDADSKWTKRWNDFVRSLEECTSSKDRILHIQKFMTAQRTKKYRRGK